MNQRRGSWLSGAISERKRERQRKELKYNSIPEHHVLKVVYKCHLVSSDDEVGVKVKLKWGDDLKLLQEKRKNTNKQL